MQDYYEELKRKRREEAESSVGSAAKSAALWGGLSGAAHALLNGNRSIPSVLMRGLGTAAVSAPAAAGATALGDAILGDNDSEDPAGFTKRGGLGGALGGGLLGAGAGYLLGSGRLRGLAHIPGAGKIASIAEKALPLDNIIADKLRKWATEGGHGMGMKAAGLLGIGGAIGGGHLGASEGMDIDALHNLSRGDEEDNLYEPY